MRSDPVIAERMHPLSPLVRMWIGVLALAWSLISSALQGDPIWSDLDRLQRRASEVPWWLLAVAAFVVIGLGVSYWTWWTTRFIIDDTELRVENTGAFQESKRIAFSRIQSVDVNQPFAARLLGLAEVVVDVGSEGSTKLSFLTRARAGEIRDYLMARAHRQAVRTSDTRREASAWDDSASGDRVLVRLRPGEIIMGALLSSEVPIMVAVFLIPVGLAWWFDLPWVGVGAGVVPMVLALFGFLSKRLFGQFNYTLAQTPAGLRITRGLMTLKSQAIPVHRVQSLQVSQPILWRPLRRARLTISVLGVGGLDGEDLQSSTVYLPIGDASQVQTALTALWPALDLDGLRFTGTPRRARWLSPLSWSWLGYAVDDRVIAVRTGWLDRKQDVLPHARVQSAILRQGPLQRRLRLASVAFTTAALVSDATIPHLESADARALLSAEMDRARGARASADSDPTTSPTTGRTLG